MWTCLQLLDEGMGTLRRQMPYQEELCLFPAPYGFRPQSLVQMSIRPLSSPVTGVQRPLDVKREKDPMEEKGEEPGISLRDEWEFHPSLPVPTLTHLIPPKPTGHFSHSTRLCT